MKKYNDVCKVWSVFPLCGKTYCTSKLGINAVDSDSSQFSWIIKEGEKIRNPDFPRNYIEHIKYAIAKHDYVFVSSHQEVRTALEKEGIPFILVYPKRSLLSNWIERYQKRDFSGFPLQVLIDNWDKWQDELDKQKCYKRFILNENEYLSNVL